MYSTLASTTEPTVIVKPEQDTLTYCSSEHTQAAIIRPVTERRECFLRLVAELSKDAQFN